jgi:hypothetical protein
MTVDQALQMAEMLVQAARIAYQDDASVVSLLDSLRAADDVARDELARAIEDANKRLTAAE